MHVVMQTAKSSAITLRNLPPEVEAAVRERADRDGTSLNKTVIRILEESLGKRRDPRRRGNGLERFEGLWTREEAQELNRRLAEERRIDPELWS